MRSELAEPERSKLETTTKLVRVGPHHEIVDRATLTFCLAAVRLVRTRRPRVS
jgi:hypothetical protein